MALVVSGMNDVLNSQGYTQAAYWNRIPTAAWGLMAVIAIGCNLLVGYGSHSAKGGSKLLPILPLDCRYRVHAYSGHRFPAPRHYCCEATEPDQPGRISAAAQRNPLNRIVNTGSVPGCLTVSSNHTFFDVSRI